MKQTCACSQLVITFAFFPFRCYTPKAYQNDQEVEPVWATVCPWTGVDEMGETATSQYDGLLRGRGERESND